jgi:hypothetical protein
MQKWGKAYHERCLYRQVDSKAYASLERLGGAWSARLLLGDYCVTALSLACCAYGDSIAVREWWGNEDLLFQQRQACYWMTTVNQAGYNPFDRV